jgi:hypothetical protein
MAKKPLTAQYGLIVRDDVDPTKQVEFDLSRNSTGTVRQISTQDRDIIAAGLQDIQDAAADKPSYYFNGASEIINCTVGSFPQLGTSDATVIITANPRKLPAAQKYLLQIYAGSTKELILLYSTTGHIIVRQGGVEADTGLIPALGKPFTFAVVRTTGFITCYLNGVASSPIAQTKSTIDASCTWYLGEPAATTWDGSISRVIIENYALTADKISRYSAGAKLDYEDVGGKMTNKINAFGTWASPGSSGDAFDSFTDNGSGDFTATNTGASGYCDASVTLQTAIEKGKAYGFNITITTPSTFATTAAFYFIGYTGTLYSISGLAAGTTTIRMVATEDIPAGTAVRFAGIGAGTVRVKLNSVVQLGCVLDLEPEGITSTKWYDSSTNNLDGTVTNALATNINHDQGVYTPTTVSRTNLTADPVALDFRWVRNHNEVTVFFGMQVTPSASGTIVAEMSLPITPYINFTNYSSQLYGTFSDATNKQGYCRAYLNGSTNVAQIVSSNTGTTSAQCYGSFSYRLK